MINGIFLSFVNILGGILGYAYQAIIGRLLLPIEYGQLTAIVSLGVFFGSPVAALIMMTARGVSEGASAGKKEKLRIDYLKILIRVMFSSLIIGILFLATLEHLQNYLNLPYASPLYLFFLYLIFWLLSSINFAYFQGLQNFKWLAIFEVSGITLKIIFAVIFVYLGLGVNGAILGMGIAAMIIFVNGLTILKKKLDSKNTTRIIEGAELKKNNPVMVVLATIGFSALTQLDVVYANMYFNPTLVGHYAAISVLGKAVFYLPGGIAMALFPQVVSNEVKGESSAPFFLKAMILSTAMCLLGATVYALYGDWILQIFYGSSYIEAGPLLGYYGFAVIPISLIMLGEQFLIAKGRTLFTWIFLIVAPLQFLAIQQWHSEIWMLILILGVSGLLIFLVGYGILIYEILFKKN